MFARMEKTSWNKTSLRIWSERVRCWKASGLTAREYARQNGLSMWGLYKWSWRLRSKEKARWLEEKGPAAPPVVEIVTSTGLVGSCGAERGLSGGCCGTPDPFTVELATGVRILVSERFEAKALLRLLDVLERR
jgi:hypothetical protein